VSAVTVEVGARVRELVTGQQGVVIGITSWLTGCDTAGVQLPTDKEGKAPDLVWYDVTRLEVVEPRAACLRHLAGDVAEEIRSAVERELGGPQPIPTRGDRR
jgi:hypothetical protein